MAATLVTMSTVDDATITNILDVGIASLARHAHRRKHINLLDLTGSWKSDVVSTVNRRPLHRGLTGKGAGRRGHRHSAASVGGQVPAEIARDPLDGQLLHDRECPLCLCHCSSLLRS
jgi:hypothetical protein